MNNPFRFNGTDQAHIASMAYYGTISIIGNSIHRIDYSVNPEATPLIVLDVRFEHRSAISIVTDGDIFYGALFSNSMPGAMPIALFDANLELALNQGWIATRTMRPGRFGILDQTDGYIESLLDKLTEVFSKFGPKTQELIKKEMAQCQLG